MSRRSAETLERSGVHLIGDLIEEIARRLQAAGIEAPRDEARDIVAIAMGQPRFWPATHLDEPVDAARVASIRAAAARRAQGAPFAYAVGRSAFRSLTLTVDQRVLIPRQETEELVQVVLDRCGNARGGLAIDIGTGSGAIALALAAEGTFDEILATDISSDALAVARLNMGVLEPERAARVQFAAGAGLECAGDRRARAIVSNPPYIALSEMRELPAGVRDWEPAIALYGGPDGLDPYRAIVGEAADRLEPGGLVALEVDARRASIVAEMFSGDRRYTSVAVHLDLCGRERFITAIGAGT